MGPGPGSEDRRGPSPSALAILSGAVGGGWVGLLDAARAWAWGARPFGAVEAATVIALWALAGAATGGTVAVLARPFRPTPAEAAWLSPHLVLFLFLAALAAGRLLPRHLATGSLAVNAGLTLLVSAVLALALFRSFLRRLRRSAEGGGPRPSRWLAAAALPLAAALPALLPGSGASPGAQATPRPDRWNVLVLVVDSLRADRVGACGATASLTPHLDRFAGDAAVFPRARTSSAWTKPSVASLFTGLRPERHRALTEGAVLPPRSPTLPELFAASGYETAVFSDNTLVCPETGFGRGVTGPFVVPFAGGLPSSTLWRTWAMARDLATSAHTVGTPACQRGSRDLAARFLDWVDRGRDGPWCAYVHWMEPHQPYAPAAPSEKGRPRVQAPFIQGVVPINRGPEIDEATKRHLVANYDDEVRETDAAFGELIHGMERRGLPERTVVLFLADHGEEFYEHGGWAHQHSLFEEVVRIPCVLRVPDGRGRGLRPMQDAAIEDLLPSLLDLAGIPAPRGLDGSSLVPLLGESARAPGSPTTGLCRRSRTASFLRSAVEGRWKLLVLETPGSARRELFFDLEADPGEQRPVESLPAEAKDRLRSAVGEALAVEARSIAAPEGSLSDSARQELEGLGYVGPNRPAPPPK